MGGIEGEQGGILAPQVGFSQTLRRFGRYSTTMVREERSWGTVSTKNDAERR